MFHCTSCYDGEDGRGREVYYKLKTDEGREQMKAFMYLKLSTGLVEPVKTKMQIDERCVIYLLFIKFE
jgi:hypothetical protein